jgi:NAD(P)-dependent dehydrogenase (short-subunit alcohol dehydrogenase family)
MAERGGRVTRRILVTGGAPLATSLATGLRAEGHVVEQRPIVDVTKAAVQRLVADAENALGGIDTIVHVHESAQERITVVDMTTEQWVAICEDSMTAAFHVTQAAHRVLSDGASGRLVFVVPTIGMAGAFGLAGSAASAESLRALTKSVAKQWGKYAITVNTIAVGPQHLIAGDIGREVAEGVSLAVPAMGSAGDAATDLAPLVSLLGMDEAHFLTGTTLVADGGVWLTL